MRRVQSQRFICALPKNVPQARFLNGRLRIPFSLIKKERVPDGYSLFWRREGDSNPWYGDYRTHDFQSCSFGQLGHLSNYRRLL